MPQTKAVKVSGFRFDGSGKSFQSASVEETGVKAAGMNWSDQSLRGQDFTRIAAQQAGMKGIPHRPRGHWTNPDENGTKQGGDWFNQSQPSISRLTGSKSKARKAASAKIAKIPFPLAQYIARVFKPKEAA